ncbi:MAG TPA: ABC transporter substrate-binding protein [Gemmatimonadales bacterium]
MRRTRLALVTLALPALAFPLAGRATAQGSIVVVTGEHAAAPVPTVGEGTTANADVADQLFLRLAVPSPGRAAAGDRGFTPQLARSWSRRDSVTLVFDLDRRARWHDGVPVTSRDVVFTFGRALDPALAPVHAGLLAQVASVQAEGAHRVVFRFKRPYADQLFDATYFVSPIPAHLLDTLRPADLQRSAFVRAPVGNGPFRWVRSVPGEFIELAAVRNHFLGRPGVSRLVFRTATDADARINLMLSGEGDALIGAIPPLANRDRLLATGEIRLVTTPSNSIGYLLFNQRAPGDSTRPHPILGDVRVRRAIVAALDREAMVRSVFGPYAEVPYGPASGMLWISALAPDPAPRDLAAARRLLADAGWRDADGDGILDRDGRPLALSINVPATSAARRQMAVQAQEQLRQAGIRLEVLVLERPVWQERHVGGNFDIGFGSATQDATPAGLTQSWSCAGGSNVAHYCNPIVDSLMRRAQLSFGDVSPLWREVLDRVEADAPAAFLFAPVTVVAVHRRFERSAVLAGAPWLMLHSWRVRRGAELPRDRAAR